MNHTMSLKVDTNKSTNKAATKAKIQLLTEEKGRKEINTKEELEDYEPGVMISYLTKDDLFHLGGFLKKIKEKSFVIYRFKDDEEVKIKFSSVKKMYVGSVFETNNDVVSITQSEKGKTNFPVLVGSTVVYYATNNFDKRRFMNTNKYIIMMKWWDRFGS